MGHLWQQLPTWRILDTDFDDARTFLNTWKAWQRDARRPHTLNYVALCEQPAAAEELLRGCESDPELATLARELGAHWFGMLPGFHRFLLAKGQVVLTLCVGEPVGLLRAQQFEADAVVLYATQIGTVNPSWFLKALAHCCRRGTQFAVHHRIGADVASSESALAQCGFVLSLSKSEASQTGQIERTGHFDPPWILKATRHDRSAALPIERCAVIGAGLSGACVAAALARRGWQVQVLDQATMPAAGASGLPVGLVAPHVSSDDCALSRLSRAGVRLMLQQARELLEIDQDWAPSGVLERQVAGTPKLPKSWPPAGQQWCENYRKSDSTQPLGPGVWHRQGAWIKPAALVKACLSQPGITFQPHAHVTDLRRQNGVWELLDPTGAVLYTAEQVVFANASGAFQLLQQMQQQPHISYDFKQHLPATQSMRGVLSWDVHQAFIDASFPPFPVNGSGSIVPRVPLGSELAWFIGSSYQPEQQPERSDQDNHAGNLEHLQQLLPPLAQQLANAFEAGTPKAWRGTRCVTADRLPAVGPLASVAQPNLWLCAGMGSRGLSFSVLCAELLAARLGAEPLPIEAKLAQSLSALRKRPGSPIKTSVS